MLIAVQSLSEMADGLQKFGKIPWDESIRGLVNMGIALAEVGVITGLVGKLAGFKSIFGAAGILITVQGLSDLADALKKFGTGEDDITKGVTGLVNMFLSLSMVAATTGVLGKLAGFSSILGATGILITIQGLSELADALKKFGLDTDDMDKGVTGLVNMFLSLATISASAGLLGKLAGLSGILGAATILLVIQGLDDIAEALKKFGDMSWDEIGRGLAAMGGALLEIAVISGVLGYLTHVFGLLGSATLLLAIQGLDDLASALQKFGSMSWDEIGRGLTAMGGALGEVALGGLLNTLSGIGVNNISKAVEPLSKLADSMKKWKDVVLPDKLGQQLGALANGIMNFTLSGWGADALATAAPAIGTMAESIKKWNGVTVPEGLPKQISSLRKALSGFWKKGWSADVMAVAAPAIGVMAESISKWSGVTVPAGIGEQMESIADGIKAFTFAFAGGWSLNAITGPLGELADDIKKWDGVKIPKGIGDSLTDLSKGVKAFNWAFVGGISLSTVVGSLGKLADDVKKWDGIIIPTGIGDSLTDLAKGVKAFSWAFMAGISFTTIIGPLGNLASDVVKWDGVTIPKGIGDGLSDLARGVKSFSWMFLLNLDNLTTSLGDLAASAKKWNDVIIPTQTSESLSALATSIGDLAGINYKTVSSGLTTLSSGFKDLGSDIIDAITNSITDASSDISTALSSVVSGALAGVKTDDVYNSFYDAGYYLVKGFAYGISSNTWYAAAKSKAMAAAAAEAAKKELDEHSPSKVGYEIGDFFGIAFVNALGDNVSRAYNASAGVAKSAISGVSDAISKTKDLFDLSVDSQPTIRPVLDISDVESGVGAISSMLNMQPSMGLLANIGSIGNLMNGNIQNGTNNDVVSAIKGLGKILSDVPHNSYNINGINYNEGSDAAETIKALIRAIKVEGRV